MCLEYLILNRRLLVIAISIQNCTVDIANVSLTGVAQDSMLRLRWRHVGEVEVVLGCGLLLLRLITLTLQDSIDSLDEVSSLCYSGSLQWLLLMRYCVQLTFF